MAAAAGRSASFMPSRFRTAPGSVGRAGGQAPACGPDCERSRAMSGAQEQQNSVNKMKAKSCVTLPGLAPFPWLGLLNKTRVAGCLPASLPTRRKIRGLHAQAHLARRPLQPALFDFPSCPSSAQTHCAANLGQRPWIRGRASAHSQYAAG